MQHRLSRQDQILEACEQDWMAKFNLGVTPSWSSKQSTPLPKWAIRKNEQDFKDWLSQQQSYTFFYDGASKNNPGVASASGSLRDPGGNPLVSYAWGLGKVSNNIAETCALWEGIKMAREMMISKILILRDSMMVTRAIIKGTEVGNNLLHNILFYSTSLLVEFEEVSILHIKCELDTIANQMAKLGSRLNAGEFVSNKVMESLPIP